MNLKPQDLRLGILIHDTVRNTNTTLQLKHFRELSISEEQFFNRYKPVAITEEMLLDFGFEKTGESRYGFKYSIGVNDWGFTIENSFKQETWFFGHEYYDHPDESQNNKSMIFVFDLMYAHQLQNIYSSSLNGELNISKFLLVN